jgi:methylated-DNA-[protein]-cysteine S-methyltransferase
MNPAISNDALERQLREGVRGGEDPGTATAALADRAAADGLLDVAYATVDTPVGPVLAAKTPRGVVRMAYPRDSMDAVLTELAREISPRVLESPSELDPVRRELEEYFEQRRHDFDLAIDWRLSHGFRRRALESLTGIPYGGTITYKELADRAGSPRAHRAAGSACGSNPIPIVVPCHRVVRVGGELGGYGGGPEIKEFLLDLEGAISKE